MPSKPAKLLRYRQTAAAALVSALVAAALPRGVTAFSLSPLRFLHQHSLPQSSLTRLRGGASVLGRRSLMMNVGAKDFDGVQVTSNFDAGLGPNPIFTSLACILSHLSIPLASISAFSAYVLVPTPPPPSRAASRGPWSFATITLPVHRRKHRGRRHLVEELRAAQGQG